MRKLAALVLAVLVAGPAAAAPVWTTPGWYQVADTIYGPMVWTGPYETQAACEAILLPEEEDAEYICEYLSERPSWDD